MTRTLRRIALAGAFLLPAALALPAHAQVPTPEGTVITNQATASYTDANGNTYSDVTASVSVTVGFLAGPDASSPVSVTPASPSTGNEIAFGIENAGNGIDQFSTAWTAGAGVTITGYRVGATTYPTLAALNTALAAMDVAAGSSVTVTVIYTVAPGQGGQTIPVTLTATSVRTPAASDATTTNVIPVVAGGVLVTPKGATVQRLPSNGTDYTQIFTVQNTGNASDTYTLDVESGNTSVVTIASYAGAGVSGNQVTIAPGASVDVTVTYTVLVVAAGSTSQITLEATSGNDAAESDVGDLTVTVVRASIAMTKVAYRDDQTTVINSGAGDRVLPGETFQYRITVTNNGAAAASDVSISDALPAEVEYVSASGDAAGWTISQTGGTVTAELSGTLAASASRYIWIRVEVR